MKKSKAGKVLMIIGIAAAAIAAFGFIVMSLWNAILPAVIGVKAISFVQALGILVLSKILFGGFGRGGGWGRRMEFKEKMREKFAGMTPEEREKFKAEWKNRCGGRMWGKQQPWQQKDAAE
jgi:Ca2+/H+ antiporter, TMEM165/GDT1 family